MTEMTEMILVIMAFVMAGGMGYAAEPPKLDNQPLLAPPRV